MTVIIKLQYTIVSISITYFIGHFSDLVKVNIGKAYFQISRLFN